MLLLKPSPQAPDALLLIFIFVPHSAAMLYCPKGSPAVQREGALAAVGILSKDALW